MLQCTSSCFRAVCKLQRKRVRDPKARAGNSRTRDEGRSTVASPLFYISRFLMHATLMMYNVIGFLMHATLMIYDVIAFFSECMTTGCSKESKGPPCCNMCCPQGETEAWYKTHPEVWRSALYTHIHIM